MEGPGGQFVHHVLLPALALCLCFAGSWVAAQGPVAIEISQTHPDPLCPGDEITYSVVLQNMVFGQVFGFVEVQRFTYPLTHECFKSFAVMPGLPGDSSCTHQPDIANAIDGEVCFEEYTMAGAEMISFDVLAVLRDDVPPLTVCVSQAEITTDGGDGQSEVIETLVQDCSPSMPDAIRGLLLEKQGDDVHACAWSPDVNAESYSVYMVVSDPLDKTLIGQGNAEGVAAHPGDIERLCLEVSLPPPACVHTGGVSAPPGCIFYQVVGVAADGTEGPN